MALEPAVRTLRAIQNAALSRRANFGYPPRVVNDAPPHFGAVILAGGQSSRMGRDKALLEVGGKTLLARQVELARETGAAEVFISSRADTDYSAFGCRVLEDELQAAGPLAGIARGLAVAREPLLLVLAVDMAGMTGDFLKTLHAKCRAGGGVVPVVNEIIEPLAAFYPKAAEGLIQKVLAGAKPPDSPGAKQFAEQCVRAGLARFMAVEPGAAAWFKSWNSPADLPAEKL